MAKMLHTAWGKMHSYVITEQILCNFIVTFGIFFIAELTALNRDA